MVPFCVLSRINLAYSPDTPALSLRVSEICGLFNSLCALFSAPILCFQQLADSFCKTPGVGVPLHDVGGCAGAQKCLSVSPLPATLTHSLSRKSFPCHSYANTRDMGVTAAPSFCSSLLSDFSRHSPVVPRHVPSALCFHTLANHFSCDPFPFTSLQISRRCGVTPSVSRHPFTQSVFGEGSLVYPEPLRRATRHFLSCYYRAGKLFTQSAFCEAPPSTIEARTHASRKQASQQPHSQTARYLSDWKRYRRPHLLRGDPNRGAQPPRRRHPLAIQALRRTGGHYSLRGFRQRGGSARGGPARRGRRQLYLWRGVSRSRAQFLGSGFRGTDRGRTASESRAAGMQQLQNARNDGPQRFGIGRLCCQSQHGALLQALRLFHALEAACRGSCASARTTGRRSRSTLRPAVRGCPAVRAVRAKGRDAAGTASIATGNDRAQSRGDRAPGSGASGRSPAPSAHQSQISSVHSSSRHAGRDRFLRGYVARRPALQKQKTVLREHYDRSRGSLLARRAIDLRARSNRLRTRISRRGCLSLWRGL